MEQVTQQDRNFLRQAIELARQARSDGRHPFGALIVNERGETVVAARTQLFNLQRLLARGRSGTRSLALGARA